MCVLQNTLIPTISGWTHHPWKLNIVIDFVNFKTPPHYTGPVCSRIHQYPPSVAGHTAPGIWSTHISQHQASHLNISDGQDLIVAEKEEALSLNIKFLAAKLSDSWQNMNMPGLAPFSKIVLLIRSV